MAAGYAVVVWVVLQLLDIVAAPLHLPELLVTTTIILLAAGFPVTLLLFWLFRMDSAESEQPERRESSDAPTSSTRSVAETGLLALLAIGMVWLITQDLLSNDTPGVARGELPNVILMDTYAPRGVYDEATVLRNGTNADVLSVALSGLPAVLQKETIGAVWNREDQIVKQNPEVIVIHRSAFFHSMNQELGFGYGDTGDNFDEEKWQRLYDIADNKLVAFLGYVSASVPQTRFIVYSRGTGGGWSDKDFRDEWVVRAESRFQSLSGRIRTFAVPGGVADGSFRKPEAAALVTSLIMAELEPAAPATL